MHEPRKELDVLHEVARVVLERHADLPTLLGSVVAALPRAMQLASRATACARHGAVVRATPRHDDAVDRMTVPFRTRRGADGVVEVGYLAPGGELLDEERRMVESIAELLCVAIDRLESDRELQETCDRLNVALSSARMGVWEWDIPTNTVHLSEQLTRLVGLDGDRTGRLGAFQDLLHPDDYAMAFDRLQRMIETGGDSLELEVRARHADGSWIRIHWLARLTRDHDGQPLRVTAALTDVTAERALEERVRQTEKLEALGHVASGVAHDFNNLLTVMFSVCDALALRMPREDNRRDLVAELRAAAERGKAITRQLLAFGQPAASAPRPLVLREVIDGMLPLLTRLVSPDCRIEAQLDGETPAVLADPTQVEQILLNLVANARDAMPVGGPIELELAAVGVDQRQASRHVGAIAGPHAMIRVEDHGGGIPSEMLAKIFEPFFTTKVLGKGTGLGLAVVMAAVRQCHGHVEVESEVGRGTCFRVYLPARGAAA